MLEAILWIIGFLLVLLLTWFLGRYCAEKMTTRKILKQWDSMDVDVHGSSVDELISSVSQERVAMQPQHRVGNTKLRLAAKNGKLLDPEAYRADSPRALNNASK